MNNIQDSNNSRIAKNTILLYFRMFFTMAVSLYTSRVVLNVLGIDDFGIYNVVGGVVSMPNVICGSLSASISRYITFELGKQNLHKLIRLFSTSVTIQILMSVLILLLAETFGLWFLNKKMVIPADRLYAANWVFQFSLATFVVNLISVPYNAAIIAHEKMSAFAYISVLEVISKLLVAYAISLSPFDKLILYAFLLMTVAILIRLVYGWYCKLHFQECHYKFILDKHLFRQMFSFAGWNFIGSASGIMRDQGTSIVLNLFGGPSINAARGIAIQVSNAIQGFVTNFMTAVNPQITKSYAAGNHEYVSSLISKSAKYSFFILLIIVVPVINNSNYILHLWLDIVPDYTAIFVQLVLIFILSESLANPLITAMLATGKIRNYQIVVGFLQFLNLPISYVLLRIGLKPYYVYIVLIIMSVICEFARMLMLNRIMDFSVKDFLVNVYFKACMIGAISILLPYYLFDMRADSFGTFLLNVSLCVLSTVVLIIFLGLNNQERVFLKRIILKIVDRLTMSFYNR